MIRAIIVDDEKISRDILKDYIIKYCPDVEVLALGESAAKGLN